MRRRRLCIDLRLKRSYLRCMSADENQTESQGNGGVSSRPGRLFQQRYVARRASRRSIPWLGYLLASINAVGIAYFIFDTPLGSSAKLLPEPLVAIAGDVTDAGRLISILVAILAVCIVMLTLVTRLAGTRRRLRLAYVGRVAAYVATSVLSTSLAVHVLKFSIGRARPLLYEQYGTFAFRPFNGDFLFQSFPSAHSAHVGALFAALALLFPRFRIAFIALSLWLASTRIIIGVHYPSDVTAGLALGFWFAFATAIVFARFGLVFSMGMSGWPVPRINRPGRLLRRSAGQPDKVSATTEEGRQRETG